MNEPKTPEGLKSHSKDYKDKSWQLYSLEELGNWVHLLVKRSANRTDWKKEVKDLEDARNYLAMMQAHLNAKFKAAGLVAIIPVELEVDGQGFIKYGDKEKIDETTKQVGRSQNEYILCAECTGKGVMTDTVRKTQFHCPVCHGKGVVKNGSEPRP